MTVTGTNQYQQRWAKHVYLEKLIKHSIQNRTVSNYPGRQFLFLANFVNQGDTESTKAGKFNNKFACDKYDAQQPPYASLFDFGGPPEKEEEYPDWNRHIPMRTVEEFERNVVKAIAKATEAGTGLMLFLRGHPSPEWIGAVGAHTRVDPEFWCRHMTYLTKKDSATLPEDKQPSTMSNIVTLRHATAGTKALNPFDRALIDELRPVDKDYKLSNMFWANPTSTRQTGDSTIRAFSMHDENYFSIEQNMTFTVEVLGNKNAWIVVVLSDVGERLVQIYNQKIFESLIGSKTIDAPWNRHRVALKADYYNLPVSERNTDSQPQGEFLQSARKIHVDYCLQMEEESRKSMAKDPLFALTELIRFSICTQTGKFLVLKSSITNVIKKLEELDFDDAAAFTDTTKSQQKKCSDDLRYNARDLERQIECARELFDWLDFTSSLQDWTTLTSRDPLHKKMREKKLKEVRINLKSLITQSEALLKSAEKCERKMIEHWHFASLSLRSQHYQNHLRDSLTTRWSWLYIPMSLVNSFFGMNMVEINNGIPGLLTWATVSVGMLILFILISIWPAVMRRLRKWNCVCESR